MGNTKRAAAASASAMMSIFDTIDELETHDRRADKKRRKKSEVDSKRAGEVLHQTKIYHHLVECRILLQRALKSICPPQHTNTDTDEHSRHDTATTTGSSTTTTTSSSSPPPSFRDTCNELLENLLQARRSLSVRGDGITALTTDNSVGSYRDLVVSSSSSSSPDNRLFHNTLQCEYDEHREEWKQVLNSRHKSVRLHSGVATTTAKSQFKVMDSSFWQQVEATVEYEQIRDSSSSSKATRKQPDAPSGGSGGGSGGGGAGSNSNDDDDRDGGDATTTTALVEFDDDSKVYQQLLKDFVANSAVTSAAGGGGSAAAAAAVERLRLVRQKQQGTTTAAAAAAAAAKKDVDRRASKGRKIRYNKEFPKLVNFTFPLSRPDTSNLLDQDAYFQSLFGGVVASQQASRTV